MAMRNYWLFWGGVVVSARGYSPNRLTLLYSEISTGRRRWLRLVWKGDCLKHSKVAFAKPALAEGISQ